MTIYGCTSLVWDIELTWEKDDLLSFRHSFIFESPHPVHEYTMRIPNKSTSRDTCSASALSYLGVDHLSRYRKKICGEQEKLQGKKF